MSILVKEWLKRLLGYGSIAASGVVFAKVKDPDIAAWAGSTVAVLGGIILNKALPWIFPTRAKIAATPPPGDPIMSGGGPLLPPR